MKDAHWLVELALRLVPREWRDVVASDLIEEAEKHAGGVWRRVLWLAWHAFAVGARFRGHHLTERRWVGHRDGLGSGWGTDVRLAFRSMRRRPWSAIGIALTLGFGIGSATATYAVFNHVVFRPVPGVADEDALVTAYYQIDASTPTRAGASYAHFEAMRTGTSALDGLVAWVTSYPALATSLATAPDIVGLTSVTDGYFEVLGVRARTGRFFSTEEYAAGDPVIVISERFAATRFAEDPSPIGRQVYLNGSPYSVIGVAAEFRGLERTGTDDVWTPWRSAPDAVGRSPERGVFQMFGRLRQGATLESAQREARAASRSVGPVTVREWTFEPVLFQGVTDGIGLTRSRLMRLYRILMAAAAALLVLACANAANLLLARNLRRRRDLVLRVAMGASRARLSRELTTEAIGLTLLAGASGLAMALILVGLLRGMPVLAYLPTLEDVSLDARVLAFCAGVSAATILLFGIGPALSASRVATTGEARAAGHVTPCSERARSALVAVQVALSFALLVGAGLLASTSWRLQAIDLGLEADGLVTFELAPYGNGRDDAILREVHERLAAVAAFDGVALSWAGPFSSYMMEQVAGPGVSPTTTPETIAHLVSPDYFDALRIPIVAGRTFSASEGGDGPIRPVVVNESFADRWFGSTNVVGRTITGRDQRRDVELEIVGVAGDVRYRELREGFVPMIYRPAEGELRVGTFLLRASLPVSEVISIARDVVHEVDPTLPIGDVGTLREDVAQQLAEERLLARVGSVIAILAALLAVAGLYAAIAFFVHERVREFAIRMALGASAPNVTGQVIQRVLVIVMLGLGAGFALVVATSRFLESRLYGVSPRDPLTIWAAALLMAVAGALAAWLPARHAVKVDPMVLLREG